MLNIKNEELLVKTAVQTVKLIEHDMHWVNGEPSEIIISLRADDLGAYLELEPLTAPRIRYRFKDIEDILPQCQLFISVVNSLKRDSIRYRIEADDTGDIFDHFGAYMLEYSIRYHVDRPGADISNRRGGEKYLPAA